jgi:two-component system phosphate regulon sensor histidine kinase PhoR
LHTILEGLSEAVFLVDANRIIVHVNKAAKDRFGQSLERLDFVRVIRHPECLQALDDVLSGVKSAQATISLQHPVPTVYQIGVTGLATKEKSDPRAAVTITDISQIYDAEQMRSDFVANVSHELRSPLTALTGFIETLKSAAKDDPAARQHFLNVMDREAKRMDRLIDDLLSLSKVEANRRVRPTAISNVRGVVENVIATLQLQAEHEGKTVVVSGLPSPVMVQGENDELTQVFHNLVENAIKYSGKGAQISISLTAHEQIIGVVGPAVSVEVRDQGPGIEPIHIPRLTERFYRVDAGRSRESGGTGLGLAIVKHIINRHRGKLQIRSEVGAGSSFTVFLPATGKGGN